MRSDSRRQGNLRYSQAKEERWKKGRVRTFVSFFNQDRQAELKRKQVIERASERERENETQDKSLPMCVQHL